ncbi:Zinc finger protein [Tetrabaena socialis]|uniref:Zinc finger protein n=1 Tax=Tetrabaena socialis TaxID=47790 RepID=A0A2J7ZXJ7_9CHLO|nr:Zinc finger protein [Tetrabaena socialis]|eukprot:PNH04978.1 Zinc finger protein [Tetrabaena socialis]
MGGTAPGKRKVGGDHKHRKTWKQQRRGEFQTRHIDQVWEDVRKPPSLVHNGKTGPMGTTAKAELDEDVPGFGKHYCIPCGKYFGTAVALASHEGERPHKRRVKMLHTTARPHNQRDADLAGDMGAPDNGPKLRTGVAAGAAEMAE